MFEMGGYECGFDDVADLGGAGSDAAQGPPAADEYGEAAFAYAAQATQQCVVGAVVHIECPPVCGLGDRSVYPDTGALVAAGGQCRQIEPGGGPVQGGEGMLTRSGHIMDRAGLDIGGPQRETIGCRERLDVAAVLVSFRGVP